MAGRSVMRQWFKYWNYPLALSRYAVHFPWPIPWEEYAHGDFHFRYVQIVQPRADGPEDAYGQEALAALRRQVSGERFDALFFKLCYIDFRDRRLRDEETRKELFGRTKTLLEKVHSFAGEQGVALIVGNALPVQAPAEQAQRLRRDYNAWLAEYAAKHRDTAVFDQFGLLTDGAGRLRREFARGRFDNHLNDRAYAILEESLFRTLSGLRKKAKEVTVTG
ncbi:MAG TPA: SGNH/GDSL hydrolase family protein, partial [Candidatus Deferrimicrobiaceae bacterium]